MNAHQSRTLLRQQAQILAVVSDLPKAIERRAAEFAALEADLAEMEASNVAMAEQIDALRANLTAAYEDIDRSKVLSAITQKDFDALGRDYQQARNEVARLNHDLTRASAARDEREAECGRLKARIAEIERAAAVAGTTLELQNPMRPAVKAADERHEARTPTTTPQGARSDDGPNDSLDRSASVKPAAELGRSDGIAITPLVQQIREWHLAGRDNRQILSFINARREPAHWLNMCGLEVILEMVVPA